MTEPKQDPEVALMGALVEAITRKGVGPKGALQLMQTIVAVAPAIADLALEAPDGQERVARAVDYGLKRAQSLVDAEVRTKPAPDAGDPGTTPEPAPENDPYPDAVDGKGSKAPAAKAS